MLFIFDMGGVVTTTANFYPRLSKLLGISLDEFYQLCEGEGAFDKRGNILEAYSDGKISPEDFWKIFSSRKPHMHVNTPWFHWLFHPVPVEGTAELVRDLKAKGHRVVVGTNTCQSHYLNHLERGDYALFDQTYTSHLMGISKPDPDFWKLILLAEDCKAEDAVFVDDKQENVDGAAALGIHSYKFQSAAELRKALAQWL